MKNKFIEAEKQLFRTNLFKSLSLSLSLSLPCLVDYSYQKVAKCILFYFILFSHKSVDQVCLAEFKKKKASSKQDQLVG